MYRRRAGTSGISGQLYETKLLSLLCFRAIHDDDIEEFQVGSNIDNIGVFDDFCLKAKVKGFDKPFAVFIQTKHINTNEKQTLNIDLAKYFNSYLKIRKLIHPSNNDLFFRGTFDETECLFVIYTTAKIDLCDDSVGSDFSAKLNYLIGTGGTVKQPYKDEKNIEYLTKTAVKDQVTALAERIAKFITEKENFPMMLTDEYLLRYHVILARQVLHVTEICRGGYRIASFCNDFFDTNEEWLILFKYTLLKEILKKQTKKSDDTSDLLSEYLAEPTDTTRLSKLVGTVITYNNGQFEFDKQYIKKIRPNTLNPMDFSFLVSRSMVNEAVELAAKEILSSLSFKVPAPFGNKDLTLRGSDAHKERRINYLASIINELLENCKSNKIVTIDESLENGFLQLNGGIAGAIGNIFVLDDNTKQMKITDNWELLESHAQRLYKKLSDEHNNLHEYKFCVNVKKFPKLLFDEKNLARDFLDKLLFFSGQADQKGVEEILINDLNNYQRDYPNYFQVKTDAIFLKYHDEIQKWWLHPKEAFYLTRNAINNIIKDTPMHLINEIFLNKIKQYNHTFTEDAVRSLNLQDQHSSTVIITDNSVLTVIKVRQHLKNKFPIVLDVEYIAKLPINDQNALRAELKNTNKTVFILVCDKIDSNKNEKTTLEDIAKSVNNSYSVSNNRTIIITNQTSLQIINRCFPKPDAILHDKKLCLFDLSEESQDSVLNTATAILPGVEIRLDLLLRGWPKIRPRCVAIFEGVVQSITLNNCLHGTNIVLAKKLLAPMSIFSNAKVV